MTDNWSGYVNFCLNQQDQEKLSAHPSRLNRTSQSRSVSIKRYSAAFAAPVIKPTLRYMPTYRLDPKFPLNKEICENIMKEVMDKAFDDFVYKPKHALIFSAQVSEEIKNRVKIQNYDRYRYICVVTIGEKLMQDYNSLANFLWDAEKDGYLSYVYDTPKFFAVATLYYLYYD